MRVANNPAEELERLLSTYGFQPRFSYDLRASWLLAISPNFYGVKDMPQESSEIEKIKISRINNMTTTVRRQADSGRVLELHGPLEYEAGQGLRAIIFLSFANCGYG